MKKPIISFFKYLLIFFKLSDRCKCAIYAAIDTLKDYEMNTI